jgi:hypothetical protein
MAKANAGRILIMPRGTYDANATYELLDLVMYNNASWLAKKTATGIEPADGEYWHKMADGVELVTNLTTEVEGKALDASMGKVLKELIDAVGADALRERLDALEADSETQSADIEAQSADIEALRVAIEALGNVDNATVRYVSDEADENFDWIQVQDADGNWVNSHRAYTTRYWLVKNGTNKANFKYTGTNTTNSITSGENLRLSITTNPDIVQASGIWISDSIDFTNYDKLVLDHFTSLSGTGATLSYASVSILDSTASTIYSNIYLKNLDDGSYHVVTKRDTLIIDVSNISGFNKVKIHLQCYGDSRTSYIDIASSYLE